MTEPVRERYTSDDSPDIVSRLLEKTGGDTGAAILIYTAVITTGITLLSIFLAYDLWVHKLYVVLGLYCYVLLGPVLSLSPLSSESRVGWFLLVPVLSLYCTVFFLLTCMMGLLFFPLFAMYLVVLAHAVRRSMLQLFSVRPIAAGITIAVPCLVVIIVAFVQRPGSLVTYFR